MRRQKISKSDPLAIRASLNEHHRGVAVPRLHGEMQWRVARAVRAVQARLGAPFWRVQQQLEEGVRAGRGCSVEGELGRAVFCVDLRSAQVERGELFGAYIRAVVDEQASDLSLATGRETTGGIVLKQLLMCV